MNLLLVSLINYVVLQPLPTLILLIEELEDAVGAKKSKSPGGSSAWPLAEKAQGTTPSNGPPSQSDSIFLSARSKSVGGRPALQ